MEYDVRTFHLTKIEFSVISVWSEKYFTLLMKGKWLSKVNGIPQMCGVCVCVDCGPWWMVAGTDQARDSANQIPSREFPLPASPSPASRGRPFPRVIRLRSWTRPPASDTGTEDASPLLILMSTSLHPGFWQVLAWWPVSVWVTRTKTYTGECYGCSS